MPNSAIVKCKASKVENDAPESAKYSKSLSIDVIEAKGDKLFKSSSHARPADKLPLLMNRLFYTLRMLC